MATKLYCWNPDSLADHTSGLMVVMADNKQQAIELAVDARLPKLKTRGSSAIERGIREELRQEFRKELQAEVPKIYHKPSAVFTFGG